MVQKVILHLSLKFSQELIKKKKVSGLIKDLITAPPSPPRMKALLTSLLCRLVALRTDSRATASASSGLPVSSSSPEVSPGGLSVGESSGAPAESRSTASSARGESRSVRNE